MMYKTIIVDDEADIRIGITKIIPWNEYGFEIVATAQDGFDALEQYHAHKPDLIVTDIKMPNMDGLELSRQVKLIDKNVQVLLISGYNDFFYAKTAIKYGINNYLLKPIDTDELCAELIEINSRISMLYNSKLDIQKKYKKLRNYFFNQLLRQELELKDAIKEAEEYNIKIVGNNYNVLVINLCKIDIEHLSRTAASIQPENYANIIDEIQSTILLNTGYAFELNENEIGIIFCSEIPLSKERLSYYANQIFNVISAHYNSIPFIAIGTNVDDIKKINIPFEQCLELIERFSSNEKRLMFYDDIVLFNNIWDFKYDYNTLSDSILDCNIEQVTYNLNELLICMRNFCLSVDDIQYITKYLLLMLSSICTENNVTWDEIYTEQKDNTKKILHTNTIESINVPLKEVILLVCKKLSRNRLKSRPKSIDEINSYIISHYNEEIDLKKISNTLYLNSFYIGKLIRKHFNMTFNEYLNKIRIEKAKEMLINTDIPIYNISEQVGYKYIDHFYRNFKKFNTLSPSKYRKLRL